MAQLADQVSPRRVLGPVEFKVLGPVTVVDGTGPLNIGGPKQRTVLAMLIAQAGNPVSNDLIAQAVYGDDAPSRGRRRVQVYVSTLRSVLGEVITKKGSGWELRVDRPQADALRFEDLYQSARQLAPEMAAAALREGLALWRGHAYADIEAHGRLDAEIARLGELRVAAQAARIDADLALGRHAELIGEIEGLIAEYPYLERFRAQHMLALYRAGRQREALHSYEEMRNLLVDELGVEPTPDLQDLELRILEQDRSLGLASTSRIERRAVLVVDPGDPLELALVDRTVHLERIADTVEAAVRAEGGNLIGPAGTAIYAVFSDSPAAVRAAESVALREDGVRTAIDFGDVEVRDGEVSGPPVARAARLVATASPGQVILSPEAQQSVASAGGTGVRVESLGEHELIGIDSPVALFQLLVGDPPRTFPPPRTDRVPPPLPGGGHRNLPGYELREPIGPGSVGEVYRAYQPALGREVMIEVIGRSVSSDAEFIRRFEADLQRLALLEHPHLLPVIDYWRDTEGAFIVYPWHRGGNLVVSGGDVDPDAVLTQIGAALAYAHGHGLVHGRLAPDRVVLDESGNSYVFGFPVAGVFRPNPESAAYLAPEAIGGRPEAASDIYSIGVLAYRLESGSEPPPDEPMDLTGFEFGDAVRRATRENPKDRHGSIGEFLAELAPAQTGRPEKTFTETRNPYKGLAAFHEADAGDFFGRNQVVGELVDVLAESRLLAVVGPSGIGKSSVVRAGLIPALRRGAVAGSEQWLITDMYPGAQPFRELERALERVAVAIPSELREDLLDQAPDALRHLNEALPPDLQLLLVVDQFEELFILAGGETARRFLDLLISAVASEQLRVVATLRADFLDRPLLYSEFGELLRSSIVSLRSPNLDELRSAISGPAQVVGVSVEPALVERIASDVHDRPGALPLLQYTLSELFESRTSDVLDVTKYEDLGGVTGSLARRADAIYEELGPGQQEPAKQLLLRLVTVVDDGPPTRRRVRLKDLEDLEAGDVLEAFSRSRLLVFDNDPETRAPTVEVAHEALLSHWPRLAGWVEATRQDLMLSRHLEAAVTEWEANDRAAAYLLGGARLMQHEAWAQGTSLAPSRGQREFLTASRVQEDRRGARRSRRRRVLIGILASSALVATLLATLAFAQSRRATFESDRALAAEEEAEMEAERATREADVARSRELAASAINALDHDPSLAKLLALSAAGVADPPLEVISVLHRAYAADPVVGRYRLPDGSHWTDLHPAGELMVTSGATPFDSADRLEVADLGTGQVLWSYQVEHVAMAVAPAYFSADGHWVVAGVYWEPTEEAPPAEDFRHLLGAHIWDAETGEVIHRFDLGRCGGMVVDVSATHLLVRTRPDTIEACWALPNPIDFPAFDVGVELVEIASGERKVLSSRAPLSDNASLSGDGQYVAFEDATTDPPTAVVLDLGSGERVLEYDPLSTGAVNPGLRALNQDGSLLLEGSRPTQVWDVASGEVIASFDIGLSPFAVFDPSGTAVYATDRDGAVRRFEATTGEELWVAPAVGGGRVSVNDEGLLLVTDPEASEALLLDTGLRGELGAVETCRGGWLPAAAHSLNVAGGLAVFHGACSGPDDPFTPFTAHVIDLEGPELLHTIPEVAGQVIRLSPDGSRLVFQDGSEGLTGPIVVADARTGDKLLELEGLCRWDEQLASAGAAREEAGDCRPYPEPPFPIWAQQLEWSPDGGMIAVVDDWARESFVAVWDARTGRRLFTRAPAGSISFTPDSQRLVLSPRGEHRLVTISTDTWEMMHEATLDPSLEGVDTLALAGFSFDGGTLYAVGGFGGGGGGAIHWFDAETLEVVGSKTRIHEGSPKSTAFSANRSLLATGASDGFVRVWHTETGALVHEIPFGDTEVQGVAFVNDRHLAVTPREGNLLIFTIDIDELLQIVRSSLVRGFTQTECQRFNFGDDCPTLEELRRG